jgi:2-dehydro-3-deoxygluconokinase
MPTDVVTIGETMMRISPPNGQRLEQMNKGDFFVGGAESNVAVALARLGKQVSWVSRLPDNPLGRQVANTIRQYGVDVNRARSACGMTAPILPPAVCRLTIYPIT